MRNVSETVATNGDLTTLVIMNRNEKTVGIDMDDVAFESQVHVCLVKLVGNSSKCDVAVFDKVGTLICD